MARCALSLAVVCADCTCCLLAYWAAGKMLYLAPPTFHAPRSIPNNIYFDSENVQTMHLLSQSHPAVALAPKDQDHFVSFPICSAVHSKGYSTSLGLSAVVPVYTLIPVLPLCSDTPPLIILPPTSFSTTALASRPQKHIASHQEIFRTFQTRICTQVVPLPPQLVQLMKNAKCRPTFNPLHP